MIGGEDNFELTSEEVKIVRRTLYGISEMLDSIMSKYRPKEYARSLCGAHRQSSKSRSRTATLDYIINEGRQINEGPSSFLQKIPVNLQNIDGSDFTDILQQFCRIFFLHNIRNKPRKDRGRTHESAYDETDLGGRYSSYQSSEYLEQVVHSLEKPEIGQEINRLLLENGLLYKYRKYTFEILYYLIRICDEVKLWNIVTDFKFANAEILKKNPKVIEVFLNKIKCLQENDIQCEAEKATQKFLITHNTGDNNFFIYVIAGVISLANIF